MPVSRLIGFTAGRTIAQDVAERMDWEAVSEGYFVETWERIETHSLIEMRAARTILDPNRRSRGSRARTKPKLPRNVQMKGRPSVTPPHYRSLVRESNIIR